MKFFGSRIITKSVSLEDAISKAKEPQKVRSLDDILADIDANNKQVKTAASDGSKKTAKPEVKAEAKPVKEKAATTKKKKSKEPEYFTAKGAPEPKK